MKTKREKTNKSNIAHYIVFGVLTCFLGVLIILLNHSGNKYVEKKVDSKAATEMATQEHLYVQVHSDTLRRLCRQYKGLDEFLFTNDDDVLFCNISVSSSAQDVIEELFTPERNEYQPDNTNIIKLEARMINQDTVVFCPIVMLFHLIQNSEKKYQQQSE